MIWNLLVANPAKKDLEKLHSREQVRLESALDAMEADPFSGDVKRLQPPAWRRHVGNYRIFYDLYLDERRIVVTAIRRRTSTTY